RAVQRGRPEDAAREVRAARNRVRKNGSIYVGAVFVALMGYFVYQWWFNPHRMVKARLGQIAATLSIPANEADIGRVTRIAQLRKLVTPDVHVIVGRSGPDLRSRDAVMGTFAAFTAPPGGWNVDFGDADIVV